MLMSERSQLTLRPGQRQAESMFSRKLSDRVSQQPIDKHTRDALAETKLKRIADRERGMDAETHGEFDTIEAKSVRSPTRFDEISLCQLNA